MTGMARRFVTVLCAVLCLAHSSLLAQETSPSVDAILLSQVETLLMSAKSQLEEVEDLLFSEPDDADMQALASDLRSTIEQLEMLQFQLNEAQSPAAANENNE